jgi:hypothetical protein
MKYACLVYHDPQKLAGLPESEQLAAIVAECAAASAWQAELANGGHHVFSAGLQSSRTATTVRRGDGKVSFNDGPFAETKEFLGGITIIEARDINEALALISKLASPLMSVEVRPVLDADAHLTDPFDQKIVAAIGRRASGEKRS